MGIGAKRLICQKRGTTLRPGSALHAVIASANMPAHFGPCALKRSEGTPSGPGAIRFPRSSVSTAFRMASSMTAKRPALRPSKAKALTTGAATWRVMLPRGGITRTQILPRSSGNERRGGMGSKKRFCSAKQEQDLSSGEQAVPLYPQIPRSARGMWELCKKTDLSR